MSKLLEFFLGSLLIAVLTIATMLFSMLSYILREGGVTDCAWHGSAKTWIDSNGDGLINNGEAPLRNVEVHIDIKNQRADVGWSASTDDNGDVQLKVSLPGCSQTLFEVYADIPEGFRITTRPSIEVNRDLGKILSAESTYYFGFISDQ